MAAGRSTSWPATPPSAQREFADAQAASVQPRAPPARRGSGRSASCRSRVARPTRSPRSPTPVCRRRAPARPSPTRSPRCPTDSRPSRLPTAACRWTGSPSSRSPSRRRTHSRPMPSAHWRLREPPGPGARRRRARRGARHAPRPPRAARPPAPTSSRASPAFLGADGPRTYFFGAVNPAELRGGGGLLGAYSLLTVQDGHFPSDGFARRSSYRRWTSPSCPVPPPTTQRTTTTTGWATASG
jgi:hypothetical protein